MSVVYNNVYKAYVVDNSDSEGIGRIKVRLTNDKDLEGQIAYPLLSKMFYNLPKVNEEVLVFTEKSNGGGLRFWIGPLIPYTDQTDFNPSIDGLAALNQGGLKLKENPEYKTYKNGIFPEKTDVGLLGRDRNDILLKNDGDIWIRVGKSRKTSVYNGDSSFNNVDMGYIMLRHDEKSPEGDASCINVVGDSINLLTSQPSGINTRDSVELISQEDLSKLNNKTYALIRGDKLMEFLENLKSLFLSHTHNTIGAPPAFPSQLDDVKKKVVGNNLMNDNDILNPKIRIS